MSDVTELNGPTWLYQACCEHGGLMYVGIAVDLDRRIAQHRATKSWWPNVDHVVGISYESRRLALDIEGRIIRGVHPRHNIAGVRRGAVDPKERDWRLLDRFGAVIQQRADIL